MTRSPGAKPRTSLPTSATSPAISWPMISGITPSPIRSARIFTSVPQTPTLRTRTSASCGAMAGVGTSLGTNGPPNFSRTSARMGPSQLHLLQGLRPRRVGREQRTPVGVARDHRLRRLQDVVRRLDARWDAAGLDRPRRLQEQPARLDHGPVGGAQVLARAVDDGPHALLDRAVLGIDAVDAGEGLGLLHAAIQQVVVLAVALRAEGALVDVEGAVAQPALEAVLVGQRVGRALLPVVDHGGVVVHRDPDVAGRSGEAPRGAAVASGTDLVEGQDEVVGADVRLAALERPQAGVPVAVVRDVELDDGGLAPDEGVRRLEARPRGVGGQDPVQDGGVRGVDAALEALEPVGLLYDFRDVAMRRGRLGPGEARHRRAEVRESQISPDEAAHLDRWIGGGPDLVGEGQLLGLVHHLDALALDVELPPVVDAAEPALLVAAEEQGGLPVRAALGEEPDAAVGVAEGHQLLAQQLDAHGRAS